MNKTAFLILLSGVAVGLSASAQSVEDLKITARSSFNASSISPRDPFWPIGWQKEGPAPVVNNSGASVPTQITAEMLLKPENYVVTSISIGRIPLAVINGKPYGEGDLIPLVPALSPGTRPLANTAPAVLLPGGIDPAGLRAQVFSIRDGAVVIRFQHKTVVARIKSAGPDVGIQSTRMQ